MFNKPTTKVKHVCLHCQQRVVIINFYSIVKYNDFDEKSKIEWWLVFLLLVEQMHLLVNFCARNFLFNI